MATRMSLINSTSLAYVVLSFFHFALLRGRASGSRFKYNRRGVDHGRDANSCGYLLFRDPFLAQHLFVRCHAGFAVVDRRHGRTPKFEIGLVDAMCANPLHT